MSDKENKLTQEQISALFCAVNEKNITAKSIMQEIQPLVDDYFHCRSEIADDCLILRFLNEQVFRLSATEV